MGNADAGQVLHRHVNKRDQQQQREGFATGGEIPEAGVDTDGGKEIHQQHIPGTQLKVDADVSEGVHGKQYQRHGHTAAHGFGDAVFAQYGYNPVQAFADEQHNDADGDRQKRINMQRCLDQFHSPTR